MGVYKDFREGYCAGIADTIKAYQNRFRLFIPHYDDIMPSKMLVAFGEQSQACCILMLIYSAGLRLGKAFVYQGRMGKKGRFRVFSEKGWNKLKEYLAVFRPVEWVFEGQTLHIQALLGHESSKTMEIYTHITRRGWEKLRSPLDDLDGI